MVRSLALGLAGPRVCVNCVAPGWIETPFNDPYWARVGDTEQTRAAGAMCRELATITKRSSRVSVADRSVSDIE
jgi:NAD(P)-dependent dehydrogenase (short-subunit alcohol dehydrogenase family)